MGADRCNLQTASASQNGEFATKSDNMLTGIANRLTNLRAKFDHRLVHLGLDLFLERDLAAFEDLVNMRSQFTRFRIDDGKLFFDPESVDVIFRDHFVQPQRGWRLRA